MIILLYLIGLPLVCIVLGVLLKNKVQQVQYLQRAVQNNSIISKAPELTESEIEARYIRNCFNNFIRRKFQDVADWECPSLVPEVFKNNTYQHSVFIRFIDGTRKKVYVNITPNDYLSCIKCEIESERKADPKVTLANWLTEWSFADKLLAQEEKEEGFLIPNEELPPEKEIIDMLLNHITEQCGFSAGLSEEGIRVAI